MAEDRRPDEMKRGIIGGLAGGRFIHGASSPSGSRTLEPYESPNLLPRVGPAGPGARFLEFDPRGLLASSKGAKWKFCSPAVLD